MNFYKNDKRFNLFFATGSRHILWLLFNCNIKNILISYAYRDIFRGTLLLKQNQVNLLCDSGAFTAWSKGDEVNLDEYIAFIKKNEDLITNSVNLDVIPGKTGENPTKEQSEQAAAKGWENLLYMKSKGLDPIHVFHQGDDFKWLDLMLENCEYIGVSPCNDFHDNVKQDWLDETFRFILESKHPDIKTHAFGVTSERLLKRYPWYSADSSSYSLTAAFGAILTPFGRFCISDQNKDDVDYIENKPKEYREHLQEYVSQFGFSYKSLQTNCQHRNIVNIMYFVDLENKINSVEYKPEFLRQQKLI